MSKVNVTINSLYKIKLKPFDRKIKTYYGSVDNSFAHKIYRKVYPLSSSRTNYHFRRCADECVNDGMEIFVYVLGKEPLSPRDQNTEVISMIYDGRIIYTYSSGIDSLFDRKYCFVKKVPLKRG